MQHEFSVVMLCSPAPHIKPCVLYMCYKKTVLLQCVSCINKLRTSYEFHFYSCFKDNVREYSHIQKLIESTLKIHTFWNVLLC
jgi:hypothetical protein